MSQFIKYIHRNHKKSCTVRGRTASLYTPLATPIGKSLAVGFGRKENLRKWDFSINMPNAEPNKNSSIALVGGPGLQHEERDGWGLISLSESAVLLVGWCFAPRRRRHRIIMKLIFSFSDSLRRSSTDTTGFCLELLTFPRFGKYLLTAFLQVLTPAPSVMAFGKTVWAVGYVCFGGLCLPLQRISHDDGVGETFAFWKW